MDNFESSEFPENEKNRFTQEYRNQDLPSDLEDKTIRELRARGMFRSSHYPLFKYLRPALFLLLTAGLFATGFYTGKNSGHDREIANNENQYLLLLHNPTGYIQGVSHAGEYGKWFSNLEDEKAQGEELQPKGWTVKLQNGKPSIEEHQIMGATGYFIIHAPSASAALKIASGCPHVKYNGEIEVRPIQTHN